MPGFGSVGELAVGETTRSAGGPTVYTKTVSMIATTTGAVLRRVNKNQTLSVLAAVANRRDVLKVSSRSVSTSVIIAKAATRTFFTATTQTTASVRKNINKAISSGVSVIATHSRSVGKNVSRVIATTVSLPNKLISATRSLSISSLVNVRRAITRTLGIAATTVSATISKQTAKPLSATVSSNVFGSKIVGLIVRSQAFTVVLSIVATLFITSRRILQDPVDAVLAGQQMLKAQGSEYEIHAPNVQEKVRGTRSGLRRHGPAPSFTTTTNKKGYT